MPYDPEVSLHDHFMAALKAQRDVMDERDTRYRSQFQNVDAHVARALAALTEGKTETSAKAALILSGLASLLSFAAVVIAFLHKG